MGKPIRQSLLAGSVQVAVDISGGLDIAMPHPLLNILQTKALISRMYGPTSLARLGRNAGFSDYTMKNMAIGKKFVTLRERIIRLFPRFATQTMT